MSKADDAALAVFVERSGRFVEKDPSRFAQQEAREGEALLFAERQFLVPALGPVELGDETAEIAVLVPAGTKHNIVNTSAAPLKLYTLYAPPNHRDGVVHRTRADAEKDN